jgi:hypothetical protein
VLLMLCIRSPRNSDSSSLDFYGAQSQLRRKLTVKPFHIIREEARVVYPTTVYRAHRYYNSTKGLYN